MENYKNAKTIIKQIDACRGRGQIVVQVCGEISNNNEYLRRFMQTFVLAPHGDSGTNYYVVADILRYLDDIWPVEDTDSVIQDESVEKETDLVEDSCKNEYVGKETALVEASCKDESVEKETDLVEDSCKNEYVGKETALVEASCKDESVEKEIALVEDSCKNESVGKETALVEEPAVETQRPDSPQKVESDSSPDNSSSAEKVVQPDEQHEAAVEEKSVEKIHDAGTATYAEEQKTAEAAPVAEMSPVVEESPKPVVKPAVPSFTEIQESQQKVAPAKKSWADLFKSNTPHVAKPGLLPTPSVAKPGLLPTPPIASPEVYPTKSVTKPVQARRKQAVS